MLSLKLHRNGITRMVFLVGKYAIKIPNFTYSMKHFLQGCHANWCERDYCKAFKGAKFEGTMFSYVAYSYFCSWFGLIQVQRRCEPLKEELTPEQKKFFKCLVGRDNKKENFGIYNGRIVCVDYP